MNHNLFWDLVRKDLALYRTIVFGTLAVGIFAVVLISRGGMMFYLGSVALTCSYILLTIFLAQFGILTERKERVHHFVLSLPITGKQYVLAKLLALSAGFALPFLLTAGAALILIARGPVPGFLPYAVTILLYFPLYFTVLASVTLASKGEGGNVAAIIFFNIAINLFIPGVMRIPSVAATMGGTEIVWTPELLTISTLELAVSVLSIAVLLWRLRTKTEFL